MDTTPGKTLLISNSSAFVAAAAAAVLVFPSRVPFGAMAARGSAEALPLAAEVQGFWAIVGPQGYWHDRPQEAWPQSWNSWSFCLVWITGTP